MPTQPRLRFGIQLCDQHPAGDSMVQRLDDIIEQVRLARDLGFDTIVAGQHYLASPLQMLQSVPLLARLAPETGDMTLATCIILLALPNPVDTAEQVASLDVITGGRLRVGVGLGYRDVEFDAFGVARDERVSRLEAHLNLLKDLLGGEAVSYESPYCRLDQVSLILRPPQRPHPPIWMGANSDRAVRRAARMTDAWVINPHARLDTLRRQIDQVYRPALADAGRPFPAELPIRREIYVARDRATAIREAAPWLFPKYEVYTSWGQDKALPAGDDFAGNFEQLLDDRFIVGSPEECIADIDRYRSALGVTEFIVRVQWPGMPQAQALRNIEAIGTNLIPHYRAVAGSVLEAAG
jgi:alkanesulfonate monooxygenase SsuD/methylene tetrahydromethanopterin reductase-like flavin-dependent oxidoreductase (luciferase family)